MTGKKEVQVMKTIVAFLLALINGAAMAEQVKIVGGYLPPFTVLQKNLSK